VAFTLPLPEALQPALPGDTNELMCVCMCACVTVADGTMNLIRV